MFRLIDFGGLEYLRTGVGIIYFRERVKLLWNYTDRKWMK